MWKSPDELYVRSVIVPVWLLSYVRDALVLELNKSSYKEVE